MVAPVISKWLPISPADNVPFFNNIKISRRTGSESALNVSAKLMTSHLSFTSI